ncbi:MAG: hypothetical protein ACE5IY_06850 [bacterium]
MRPLLASVFICLCLHLSVRSGTAQPTVSHGFVNQTGLDVFFLKDFDINRPGNGPPVFFVLIQNDTRLRDGSAEGKPRVVLRLSIKSQRHDVELSSGTTVPFTLMPNENIRLSNNDLFTNSGPYRFDEFRIASDLLADLLDDILTTGKLPSDVYKFKVELAQRTEEGQIIPFSGATTDDTFEIRVTNPRRLDLIFPGAPATGRRGDCQRIFTNLPQFRWESDMRLFRVVVAEVRPGEDPESILNQEPRFVRNYFIQKNLRRRIPDLNFAELRGRIEILPAPTFQYPASGEVLALRPGKAYLWRVTGFVQSSSGLIPLQSEIFCFGVPRLDRLGSPMQQLGGLLKNLLGPDYDKIFGEGGELEGYEPRRITFNGKEVTLPEIFVRLQKLNNRYSGYRIEN